MKTKEVQIDKYRCSEQSECCVLLNYGTTYYSYFEVVPILTIMMSATTNNIMLFFTLSRFQAEITRLLDYSHKTNNWCARVLD